MAHRRPLVRRLLAARFPRWTELPIEPFPSPGTVNALFRPGDDMAVRLPRIEGGAGEVAKEHRWLPLLAPRLPALVPVVLGKGEPAEGYPWPARGRGRALSMALIQLPYYRETNPVIAPNARHVIREVLADHGPADWSKPLNH